MRNLSISLSLFALVALLASIALAQAPRRMMTVDVPFDFVVLDTVLPAGEYTIDAATWGSGPIWIRNRDFKHGTGSLITPSRNKGTAQNSELVFHRYGDTYFLHKLSLEGFDYSSIVPKSKTEREIELAAARTTVKIPTVQLANK
jgi:hypothetical protein